MALITAHDILGNSKLIDECTLEDIPAHFELIKHWVPEEEHQEFKDRMAICVQEGRAYTMCSSQTFLYYKHRSKNQVDGVALYGKESPIDLLALFAGVFKYIDRDVFMMYFKLHPGKFVEEYKSLVTPISVRRQGQDPERPLAIRIDNIKKKVNQIFETRGFE